MRIVKWVIIVALVLFGVAVLGFTVWAYTPLGPSAEALAALASDAAVTVSTEPWLTFTPIKPAASVGFVLYPGGRVDARSYAPQARAIAEQGYLVVIPPMPFNLAVFGVNKADAVMAAHPEITDWAVGGHSLGGAMAASYLFSKEGPEDGLVLWAAYPASGNNLAERQFPATSIYGTVDGVALPDEVRAGQALLPPDAVPVPIQGGNHAQFGSYGPQPGDNPATISPEAQREQTTEATVQLLQRLAVSAP